MILDAAVWALSANADLTFQIWPDEDFGALFNRTNGDTHLVSVAAIEILMQLQDAPASVADMAFKLSALFEDTDMSRQAMFVQSNLIKLRDIGLVTSGAV